MVERTEKGVELAGCVFYSGCCAEVELKQPTTTTTEYMPVNCSLTLARQQKLFPDNFPIFSVIALVIVIRGWLVAGSHRQENAAVAVMPLVGEFRPR